jgi:hypothetical protein
VAELGRNGMQEQLNGNWVVPKANEMVGVEWTAVEWLMVWTEWSGSGVQ